MALSASMKHARFSSIFCLSKGSEKKELAYFENDSLFDVLTKANLMNDSGTCLGNQACGKCKIKVIEGNVPKPEEEEIDMLGDAPPEIRLACAISLTDKENGSTFQVI